MNNEQREIPFSPPDISNAEGDAILDVLKSGWITTGSKTKAFERGISEYCGTSKTVCLNSATAAMELTLRLLGVGPGDEVITTPYTYTASASVIHHVGAKIVMVDLSANSFEMDYSKIAESITERTKVIIPVDIGGVMCDYEALYRVLESRKRHFTPCNDMQRLFNRVIVLSDAAHSFGSEYHGRMSGTAGDFTCFSFHAVKNLTTAEGGAVTWTNRNELETEEIYRQFMLLSLHGQSKDAHSKMQKGSWEYDIIYPAYKCNMTDITAAFGTVQLDRFPQICERRRAIVRAYDKKLLPVGLQALNHFQNDRYGNGHLYLVRIPDICEDKRNYIISEMAKRGVSCNVHFKPLPMFTAYKKLGFKIEDFPIAYSQYSNCLTLPVYSQMKLDDAAYVSDSLIDIVSNSHL